MLLPSQCRIPLLISLLALSMFCVTLPFGHAQSTDPENPSWLATNELKGKFDGADKDTYYHFVAGPGTLTFTVNVRSELSALDPATVTMDLHDAQGNELFCCFSAQSVSGKTEQQSKSVKIHKKQNILMHLSTTGPNGNYRIKIDGPNGPGKSETGNSILGTGSAYRPPPKDSSSLHGSLRMEMKDGTVQEIDLGRVKRMILTP